MKKHIPIIMVLLLQITTGCAGLAKRPFGYEHVIHKGVKIFKWQRSSSIENALGAPDLVSSHNPNATKFLLRPGTNTVEWVYLGPVNSTIIYVDRGYVSAFYQIPTKQVRRFP